MDAKSANNITHDLANAVADTGLTSKGYERVAAILDCAIELLAEEGYAAVSLSEVARRTGIAKGNVQYYFATNAALMRGALKAQVAGLKAHWQSTLDEKYADAQAKLSKLIVTDIAISRSEKHKALALEKWAYANRDPEARVIVHEWYAWVIEAYRDVLSELRSDLSRKEVLQLAALMNALLEGSTPFFGRSRLRYAELAAMTGAIEQAVWALVTNYRSGPHQA